MNSTELIALAERRFEELGGEERAGEWRSWYRGFLEGFLSARRHYDTAAVLDEALNMGDGVYKP